MEYREDEEARRDGGMRSSRSYRRYFQDYTYQEVTGKNGKVKMVRVYTGAYYTPALSRRGQVVRKFLYTGLWLVCGGALVLAADCEIGRDFLQRGALIYGLTGLALLWMLNGLINYLFAPMRRTAGEWRSSTESLKVSTAAGGLAFLLCAGANLLLLVIHRDQVGARLFCALVCLAGGGVAGLWSRMERKTEYQRTEADAAEHV